MTESVITAAPDWSLEHAAAEMSRRSVRHLVVFDEGEVVGILSMRDIVRVWTSEGATSEFALPRAELTERSRSRAPAARLSGAAGRRAGRALERDLLDRQGGAPRACWRRGRLK